jgi:hypothetical protein
MAAAEPMTFGRAGAVVPAGRRRSGLRRRQKDSPRVAADFGTSGYQVCALASATNSATRSQGAGCFGYLKGRHRPAWSDGVREGAKRLRRVIGPAHGAWVLAVSLAGGASVGVRAPWPSNSAEHSRACRRAPLRGPLLLPGVVLVMTPGSGRVRQCPLADRPSAIDRNPKPQQTSGR